MGESHPEGEDPPEESREAAGGASGPRSARQSSSEAQRSGSGGGTSSSDGGNSRKRLRDPAFKSGYTPPAKVQAGRFSYATAAAGGDRLVFVRLDGSALAKEDISNLGTKVNLATLEAIDAGQLHEVPDVETTAMTRLGLEVISKDARSSALVKKCAAKVNLVALTAEELEEQERPLRKYSGFMRGDANANLTKDALQALVNYQIKTKRMEGRLRVDKLVRTDTGCIIWLAADRRAEESLGQVGGILTIGFAGRVKFTAAQRGEGEKNEDRRQALTGEAEALETRTRQIKEELAKITAEENCRQFSQLEVQEGSTHANSSARPDSQEEGEGTPANIPMILEGGEGDGRGSEASSPHC